MARERAKLTDKQERILVQCQLMGLTTRDMTQISNRLVALERERAFKADIAEAVADKTWTKVDKGWQIVDTNTAESMNAARPNQASVIKAIGTDRCLPGILLSLVRTSDSRPRHCKMSQCISITVSLLVSAPRTVKNFMLCLKELKMEGSANA